MNDEFVWGASTYADLSTALDGAHELSGAPHERITELIRQRNDLHDRVRATSELIGIVTKARAEGWYEDNPGWDRVDELLAVHPKLCCICKGYGQYQDGDSGSESDGHAPNIVRCECAPEERHGYDDLYITCPQCNGLGWDGSGYARKCNKCDGDAIIKTPPFISESMTLTVSSSAVLKKAEMFGLPLSQATLDFARAILKLVVKA